MQAYALARPSIRFRLHVLKSKNNSNDFIYAPKADANMEDVVMKIMGRDCAAQCGWASAEADGFEIHGFLPRPTAIGSKISGYGSFVSVDGRPVSSSRGTIKQLVHAYKDRLGRTNPSLVGIRDPFLCFNIVCPPDSYDPNIEPAKDNVMFQDSDVVLGVLGKLLESYYPETIVNLASDEQPLSSQQICELQLSKELHHDLDNVSSQAYNPGEGGGVPVSQPQPRWRSSMYGIDEDDLEFLQEDRTPILDEEEGRRAIEISNPWTIARMNAAIKPRQPTSNGQLLSPAKSMRDVNLDSSPSRALSTPNRITLTVPLTSQTSSKTSTARSLLDDELERSIQRLPQPPLVADSIDYRARKHRGNQHSDGPHTNVQEPEVPSLVSRPEIQAPETGASPSGQHGDMALGIHSLASRGPLYEQPAQNPKPSRSTFHPKRSKDTLASCFPTDNSRRRRAGQTVENHLSSENNTDIRDFFSQTRQAQGKNPAHEQSFTAINPPVQPVHSRYLNSSATASNNIQSFLQNTQDTSQVSPFYKNKPTAAADADTTTSLNDTHAPLLSPRRRRRRKEKEVHTASRTPRHQSAQETMSAFFRRAQEEYATVHSSGRLGLTRTCTRTSTSTTPLHTTLPPPSEEQPPHSIFGTRNLTLHLCPSTQDISRCTRILYETCQEGIRDWDYMAKDDHDDKDACRSFNKYVSETRIAEWVRRLDGMLGLLYERVGSAGETRDVLREGIRRGLLGRCGGEGVVDDVDMVRVDMVGGEEEGGRGGEEQKNQTGTGEVDNYTDDEDEDDVEDEMLMDL
jgi:hypothetical protein